MSKLKLFLWFSNSLEASGIGYFLKLLVRIDHILLVNIKIIKFVIFSVNIEDVPYLVREWIRLMVVEHMVQTVIVSMHSVRKMHNLTLHTLIINFRHTFLYISCVQYNQFQSRSIQLVYKRCHPLFSVINIFKKQKSIEMCGV